MSELETPARDTRALAASLAPVLVEACPGRLRDLVWFKADWQRGGAATGQAVLEDDRGATWPVVCKLPVGPRELTWTRRLQDEADGDPVVPRLHASGDVLAGYDLAWVVIERFEHGPLGAHWHDDHIPRIAEAAARFHQAARRFPIDQPPRREEWPKLVDQAAENVRLNDLPDRKRWLDGLKALKKKLGPLVEEWDARPCHDWLHGDLHIANAMSRHGLENGRVSLIDLAEVHVGHWIEDAVYLERQFWARPDLIKQVKPVQAIARARRDLGLPDDGDTHRLGMIRRALLAGTAPRYLKSEGRPAYLAACLDRLETSLQALA